MNNFTFLLGALIDEFYNSEDIENAKIYATDSVKKCPQFDDFNGYFIEGLAETIAYNVGERLGWSSKAVRNFYSHLIDIIDADETIEKNELVIL